MTEVNENRLQALEQSVGRLETSIALLKSHWISELGGEGTQGNLRRLITETNDQVREMRRTVARFIDGDGSQPGARVLIDRNTTARKAGIWIAGIVVAAIIHLLFNGGGIAAALLPLMIWVVGGGIS